MPNWAKKKKTECNTLNKKRKKKSANSKIHSESQMMDYTKQVRPNNPQTGLQPDDLNVNLATSEKRDLMKGRTEYGYCLIGQDQSVNMYRCL